MSNKVSTYEIRISEDEFLVLKALAERWFYELQANWAEIEEMPRAMREAAYEELSSRIDTAKNLCAELGVSINE